MKRNPRKVKWTKAYRKTHGKEIAEDATFALERRRNRPLKYNREVMGQTIMAMQRITEIRQARQALHWEKRMRAAKKVQIKNDKQQLEQEIHLVRGAFVDKEKEKAQKKVRIAVEEARREEMEE